MNTRKILGFIGLLFLNSVHSASAAGVCAFTFSDSTCSTAANCVDESYYVLKSSNKDIVTSVIADTQILARVNTAPDCSVESQKYGYFKIVGDKYAYRKHDGTVSIVTPASASCNSSNVGKLIEVSTEPAARKRAAAATKVVLCLSSDGKTVEFNANHDTYFMEKSSNNIFTNNNVAGKTDIVVSVEADSITFDSTYGEDSYLVYDDRSVQERKDNFCEGSILDHLYSCEDGLCSKTYSQVGAGTYLLKIPSPPAERKREEEETFTHQAYRCTADSNGKTVSCTKYANSDSSIDGLRVFRQDPYDTTYFEDINNNFIKTDFTDAQIENTYLFTCSKGQCKVTSGNLVYNQNDNTKAKVAICGADADGKCTPALFSTNEGDYYLVDNDEGSLYLINGEAEEAQKISQPANGYYFDTAKNIIQCAENKCEIITEDVESDCTGIHGSVALVQSGGGGRRRRLNGRDSDLTYCSDDAGIAISDVTGDIFYTLLIGLKDKYPTIKKERGNTILIKVNDKSVTEVANASGYYVNADTTAKPLIYCSSGTLCKPVDSGATSSFNTYFIDSNNNKYLITCDDESSCSSDDTNLEGDEKMFYVDGADDSMKKIITCTKDGCTSADSGASATSPKYYIDNDGTSGNIITCDGNRCISAKAAYGFYVDAGDASNKSIIECNDNECSSEIAKISCNNNVGKVMLSSGFIKLCKSDGTNFSSIDYNININEEKYYQLEVDDDKIKYPGITGGKRLLKTGVGALTLESPAKGYYINSSTYIKCVDDDDCTPINSANISIATCSAAGDLIKVNTDIKYCIDADTTKAISLKTQGIQKISSFLGESNIMIQITSKSAVIVEGTFIDVPSGTVNICTSSCTESTPTDEAYIGSYYYDNAVNKLYVHKGTKEIEVPASRRRTSPPPTATVAKFEEVPSSEINVGYYLNAAQYIAFEKIGNNVVYKGTESIDDSECSAKIGQITNTSNINICLSSTIAISTKVDTNYNQQYIQSYTPLNIFGIPKGHHGLITITKNNVTLIAPKRSMKYKYTEQNGLTVKEMGSISAGTCSDANEYKLDNGYYIQN